MCVGAGDCYIAACGILSKEDGGFSTIGEKHDAGDSARRVMEFAKSILEASKQVREPLPSLAPAYLHYTINPARWTMMSSFPCTLALSPIRS